MGCCLQRHDKNKAIKSDDKNHAIEVQVQAQKANNQKDQKQQSAHDEIKQVQGQKSEPQSEQEIIIQTPAKGPEHNKELNVITIPLNEEQVHNPQSEQEIAKSIDKEQTLAKHGKLTIKIIQENIVKQKVQAIVNAANAQLARGGGVCGAIFGVCGYQLDKDCDEITKDKPLKTSEVVITSSHDLGKQGDDYAQYIIHAVGPVWDGSEARKDLLRKCVYNVLKLAMDKNIHTLSIPAISSGIYGFPKDVCAQLFEDGINQFKTDYCTEQKLLDQQQLTYEMTVNLCNFDYETFYIFDQHFNKPQNVIQIE